MPRIIDEFRAAARSGRRAIYFRRPRVIGEFRAAATSSQAHAAVAELDLHRPRAFRAAAANSHAQRKLA